MPGIIREIFIKNKCFIVLSFAVIGTWFILTSYGWAESIPAKVRQGNRQFEQKNYEQALQQYSEALATDPNRSEIRYNLGNTLHRLGKQQEAAMELKKAASSGPASLQTRAHYNLGNVLFQSGDYRGAVAEFSASLKSDANDKDAKYNLELALRKMEEEKQKQSQDKDKQSEKNKQDKEKQQEQKGSQDKNQQQGKDQEKQDPSKGKDSGDQKQQPSGADQEQQQPASDQKQPSSPQQWKNIGQKEAEQILRAMEAKEGRELQRQQQLVRQKQGKERDW